MVKKIKKISTLVEDIHTLIDTGKHKLDTDNLNLFLDTLKYEVTRFLAPYEGERKNLRLSAVGREDRKLWYEMNDTKKRKISPQLRMRFFYGNIVEALLLFLAQESGHVVKDQQKEVKLEGVKGHIDAIIDDVLVDVKSASDYSFKKFKNGTLFEDDPFGYLGQISSYMEALNLDEGAFLAFNKNTGAITLLEIDELMTINASSRIKHLKKVIKQKTAPDRCYGDEEYGTSGNRVVNNNCNYCEYRVDCWKDANAGKGLRTFKYASGYKYFTKIVNEPKVEEIRNL